MSHIATGNQGEELALNYFRAKGYRILARKFRSKAGEIDIVARHGDTLVFIEVKTRKSLKYGIPSEAVTRSKQQKILKTALCYLNLTRNNDVPLRFDVLEILMPQEGKIIYNHLVNAFGG